MEHSWLRYSVETARDGCILEVYACLAHCLGVIIVKLENLFKI